MNFQRHTRTLLAALLPLGALHCSEGGMTEGVTDALDIVEGDCAAATPSPMTGEGAFEIESGDCRFDADSLAELCVSSSRLETLSRRYASVEDYLEAAEHFGKVTSLDELQRSGALELFTVNHFDEAGRLARSVQRGPEGEIALRFSDYDSFDRPRQALLTSPGLASAGCSGQRLALEYDELSGRILGQISSLDSACPESAQLGASSLPLGIEAPGSEHQLCP